MSTVNLEIRLATEADAESVREIYAPFVSGTAVTFETLPPDRDEIARRIRETLKQTPWLVGYRSGDLAGYAYASRHRERAAYQWAVEVSVYVAASCRGQGVGRALYEELFKILRRQGYVHAIAGIALPNPASVSLHERMGFKFVGVYKDIGFKVGSWHDVGWWQLQLAVPEASPPPEPVPLPRLSLQA